MKCFEGAHLHGLGAPVLHLAGMLPSYNGFFLYRCVAALKADLQNSHGGPARVGGTLHC